MRRRSRECALQILFQMDANGTLVADSDSAAIEEAIRVYWSSFDDTTPLAPPDREFTERLVRGVAGNLDAVDSAIDDASSHWRIGRMSNVDRNLIRMAAYEIDRCPDIPPNVSINEALEIAKRFSGTGAVGFVNGVLDALAKVSAVDAPQ